MQAVLKDAEERMKKVLATLDKEFSRLRTGRASSSLLDGLRVDYYGTMTQLDQLVAQLVGVPSRSSSPPSWVGAAPAGLACATALTGSRNALSSLPRDITGTPACRRRPSLSSNCQIWAATRAAHHW